jgi:rare lipoprotein A
VRPFAASILPKLPDPNNGKKYRVQVGSYKLARNAVDAFNRLQTAGLNPAYERYNDLYRVVLAGIGSNEILIIAERLGAAGFPEALIREEP